MSSHSEPVRARKRCMGRSTTRRFSKFFGRDFKSSTKQLAKTQKTHPQRMGLLSRSALGLRTKFRNKNKRRRIGKIWRWPFLRRPFCHFLGLLASAEIFCVFAINRALAAAGQCGVGYGEVRS